MEAKRKTMIAGLVFMLLIWSFPVMVTAGTVSQGNVGITFEDTDTTTPPGGGGGGDSGGGSKRPEGDTNRFTRPEDTVSVLAPGTSPDNLGRLPETGGQFLWAGFLLAGAALILVALAARGPGEEFLSHSAGKPQAPALRRV